MDSKLGDVPSDTGAMVVGIMAAMPVEVEKLKQNVTAQEEHKHGMYTFTTGQLVGKPVVFAPANVRRACQQPTATSATTHQRRSARAFACAARSVWSLRGASPPS